MPCVRFHAPVLRRLPRSPQIVRDRLSKKSAHGQREEADRRVFLLPSHHEGLHGRGGGFGRGPSLRNVGLEFPLTGSGKDW